VLLLYEAESFLNRERGSRPSLLLEESYHGWEVQTVAGNVLRQDLARRAFRHDLPMIKDHEALHFSDDLMETVFHNHQSD
jgi:hypothetical protein